MCSIVLSRDHAFLTCSVEIFMVFYFVFLTLQLFATVTIDEPAPGLKTILSFTVPDQRSGKVRDFAFINKKYACLFYS
jgi:hypothetical protein